MSKLISRLEGADAIVGTSVVRYCIGIQIQIGSGFESGTTQVKIGKIKGKYFKIEDKNHHSHFKNFKFLVIVISKIFLKGNFFPLKIPYFNSFFTN